MATLIDNYDVEAVNSAASRQLYKKREPIYPKRVHGKYRLIKWVMLVVTLTIYYGVPWLRWERGPHEPNQAVLIDFPGERFYFFFIELWPNELYLLTGLLVFAALVLFLVTAVFGRLWCGYSCPQTVWTDLFIAVERFVEGDRNKRIRLASQPWNADKIRKKLTKHALWIFIAAATGGAWVLYFHDAPTVMRNLFLGTAPATAYIFLGLLTFTTYTLAGIMREQVCVYMCPWPRIQAAMTDEETFSVGYYARRGEPRGKHKKGEDWAGRGACVDCKACVAACPMGIDIRDGDQLECINCGLCIDACDDVMKRLELPVGLIGYGADYREQADPARRRHIPALIRSRTIFYGVALAIVSTLLVVGLVSRASVDFGIERNRAPAYTMLSDGSVRNAITLRVLNKHSESVPFDITFDGPEALEVSAVGQDMDGNGLVITVPSDSLQRTRIFLTMPEGKAAHGAPVTVTLVDRLSGKTHERTITFLAKG